MKGNTNLLRILAPLLAVAALMLAIPLSGLAAPAAAPPNPPTLGTIPTPDEYLKMQIGADYVLADWPQIVDYFQAVDKLSNRVQVEDLGETTMGQPFIMAVVTAPENFAKLDRYLEIQKKLADPTLLAPGEAEKLMAEAKPVVSLSASIHSTEIAGTQLMLKLLYRLTATNSAEVREILDNVIVLMTPSLNPDGHQMEVEWYYKYLKDNPAWAGAGVPWLYGYYAGHDNNRDFFMFNLKESRAFGAQVFQKWFPEIVYDIHQMGNRGARLFVPPFIDPPNPTLNPIFLRSQALIGSKMAVDLAAQDLKGVVNSSQYDSWYHGALRPTPGFHNMVGVMTEAASVGLASPINQKWEDLTGSTRGLADSWHQVANFPDPWPGGKWSLSDIIAYEDSAVMSTLSLASHYGDEFVRNFYTMNMEGIEGKSGSMLPTSKDLDPLEAMDAVPYAYVFQMDQQRDPVVTAKLLNTLLFQGVQVNRAEAPFTAGGVTYPAGTYVVLSGQPSRANVLALLSKQVYPERKNPDGSAEAPYDVAGWTLAYEMGVNLAEVADKFDAKLARVQEASAPSGAVMPGSASYGYVFGPELNNAATARFRLLEAGFELQWVMEGASLGGKSFASGATIVKAKAGLDAKLATLAKELGVTFYPLSASPSPAPATKSLSLPRIGLYDTWSGNADTGWRRFVLDEAKIPFTLLRDKDIQAGGLNAKFDVILLPDASYTSMLNGLAAGSVPPEYAGGIGEQGKNNLVAFANGGGSLLSFGKGGEFAINALGVPVKNALSGVTTKQFYCPGSVLQVQVDNTSPVAFGLGSVADVYFANNPVYEITGAGPKAVLWYGPGDPVRSGWVMGPQYIQNKTAVVDAPVGSGRAIMVGFAATWRGQTHGAYKLLFDSVFYATAK